MPNNRSLTEGKAVRTISKVKRQTRFDDQDCGSHQIVAVLGHARRRRNKRSGSQERFEGSSTQSCLERSIPAAGDRLAWKHDSHEINPACRQLSIGDFFALIMTAH
jgi:hypothetical protein